jgi:lipopolysaccharide/colanic/teichoic acid biosynthesis glycosyltransferase
MTRSVGSQRRRRAKPDPRRIFDLVVAIMAIILLSPIAGLVAALVRLHLGRPVLFRQRRVGMNGKEFSILKFRTMHPESYPGQPDKERETRLGSVLRSTSLDELPQLVNILRADMSTIGPRPTLPEQVRHYNPRQRGRLTVRPGLTGLAQVKGRNSLSWPERIELDLWYIENRCWPLDLRILCSTVSSLVRRRDIVGQGGVNSAFTPDMARNDRQDH